MADILGDLLGNVINGALRGQQQPQAGGSLGGLGDLLGGLLGGGQNASAASPSASNAHQVGGISLAALLPMAMMLLQQSGGIGGLLDKFRQAGFGQQADSWQSSTQKNIPVDANAINDVFGGSLGQIASQFGMNGQQAAGGLAAVLPELLNQLTPQGQVQQQHEDVIGDLLGMLTKR